MPHRRDFSINLAGKAFSTSLFSDNVQKSNTRRTSMHSSVSNACHSLVGLLLLLALAFPALAQAPTGSVRGVIRDQSDAVISGAKVIVSSKSGIERNFSTKSDGEYQVGNLPPGEYEIKVAVTGFKA